MIQRTIGTLLFAIGLAIFAAAVLRVPLSDTPRLDLHPKPDAEQYLAGAVSLHRHGRFAVELGGQLVPPRYPFGYSLLMVPWLAAGAVPITVPFLVNGAVGLATLIGLFAVLWRRSPLAGGTATVLLSSWPAFIVACRSPLSEASGGAVLLLAFWGLVAYASGGSWMAGACGALLLGASVWFRLANVFLAPVLIFVALALSRSWRARARTAASLSAAYALGISPLLWYNLRHFGSPFRTGYTLWVPYWADVGHAFGVRYVSPNLSSWWADLVGAPHPYNTADLYAMGAYLSPALVMLMLVTAIAGLRRRAELAAASAIALSVAALALYFFQDARLLFPTLLLAIPFVARESATLLARAADRRLRSGLLAALVAGLVAASVAGFPPKRGRWGLQTALDLHPFRGHSTYHRLVQELDRVAGGRPALVLAAFAPVYVASVASLPHVVVPLSDERQPLPEQPVSARHAQMLDAIARSQPVYLVIADRDDTGFHLAAPPAGYGWRVLYTDGGVRLSQLVPLEQTDRTARGVTSPAS